MSSSCTMGDTASSVQVYYHARRKTVSCYVEECLLRGLASAAGEPVSPQRSRMCFPWVGLKCLHQCPSGQFAQSLRLPRLAEQHQPCNVVH